MSRPVTVEILAIGNELLRGEIQDTNTHWICRFINNRGGRVERATMLTDRMEVIAEAIRSAITRGVTLLLVSGGLGPTDDDLTLAAVAEGAGVALELNETARQMVRERYDEFCRRGILAEGGLNPFREKMAWLPEGAQPLHNPVGTAPGVLLNAGSTAIVCLPGVPPELEGILTYSLADCIDRMFGAGGSFSRTITVRCNDESIMVPALSRVIADCPQVYIKSLARELGGTPELDIFFTINGGDAEGRKALVDNAVDRLRQGLTGLGIAHWEKGESGHGPL
jgi:nicotinamide-nucleotide amidase